MSETSTEGDSAQVGTWWATFLADDACTQAHGEAVDIGNPGCLTRPNIKPLKTVL